MVRRTFLKKYVTAFGIAASGALHWSGKSIASKSNLKVIGSRIEGRIFELANLDGIPWAMDIVWRTRKVIFKAGRGL